MLPSRSWFDAGLVLVAVLALVAALLTFRTVRRPFAAEPLGVDDALALPFAILFAGFCGFVATANADGAAVATLAALAVGLAVWLAFPRLTAAGVLQISLPPLALLIGAPWGYALLRESGAPDPVLTLAIGGAALSAVAVGFAVAEQLARTALLSHQDWRRPTAALAPFEGGTRPKVSIHLPAYAEPPEIVCDVLDRLARLDYPDFEVLVCDNNTPDESLWRPVERRCAQLNRACGHERFRFFHVAPLAGAKAGALNWLLDRMDPAAELVAVIDADYLARPDFLSRLVGFFDDPAIGYLQTPHDYRGWEASAYLRACYWEYMPSNKIEMPGINEYGAAFTIGTMCLIRAAALEAAGRWADWCLTEDSEVSVRLRALGCHGLYLRETFGRGLIPETFDDYKKQRFRWTAGPVQQLRRHWRLYVPRMLGGTDHIAGWSKLLEVQRALAPLRQFAGAVLGFAGAVAGIVMVTSGVMPALDLPPAAWTAMTLGTAAALVSTVQRYRLSGCTNPRDMAMGELARLSLGYVQMLAGVAGLSSRPLAWRRTPKFAAERAGWRAALASTRPEIAIAGAWLALLAATIWRGERVGGDMLALVTLAAGASALRFLAAPAMALLSERRLAGDAASGVERLREASAG